MALTSSAASAPPSPQALLTGFYQAHADRVFLRLALAWYRKRIVPSHFFRADFPRHILDWLLEVTDSLPEAVIAQATEGAKDAEADEVYRIQLKEVLPQLLRAKHDEIEEAEAQLRSVTSSPIDRLREEFGLSDLEQELVMFALVVTIDPKVLGLCAAIRGLPEMNAPTIQLALQINAPTLSERCEAIAMLLSDSPLFSEYLLQVSNSGPLLEREFALTQGVARFLMAPVREHDDIPRESVRLVSLRPARGSIDSLVLEPSFIEDLEEVIEPRTGQLALVLTGREGDGVELLAEAICHHLSSPMCSVNLTLAGGHSAEGLYTTLSQELVEPRLRRAIPVVKLGSGAPPDPSLQEAFERRRRSAQSALGRWPGALMIFVCDRLPDLDTHALGRPAIHFEVPALTGALRRQLWKKSLPEDLTGRDTIVERLSRLPLNRRQVRRVAQTALALTEVRRSRRELDVKLLAELCQDELSTTLQGFGKRIVPKEVWGSLILHEGTEAQLRELIARARHREMIFEAWGMRRRFSRGGGLTALFSGPPGTGKTTAAEIIASDLGLVLYRIDMSRMISKFVGETEKNLGKIFDQATESGALLLFDEADSLFAKRTEVKSSMDRYSNQTVNYLLERLESYTGVAVLTTNLPKSIDAAFQRRIAQHVHFPEPTVDERVTLWRHFFPEETPLEPDIDWEEISETFELTGGHIKNAALRAAVLAAQRGTAITHEHIFEAAAREYRAMGRLVSDFHF